MLLPIWQGGRTASQDDVTLKTLRRLPHTYLFHQADGWKKVRENIASYEPYGQAGEEYRRRADGWEVADPMADRPFCYETKEETGIMSTAYAFALTGERKYALKLADFFRRFSNPVDGYPARKRGCSQSYVQEGHFFKHLAVAYDMIFDSGVLTDGDKAAMEHCFRLYMRMLDVHLLDGWISNWLLSELHGVLFCALTLQDMDLALRFTFGPGVSSSNSAMEYSMTAGGTSALWAITPGCPPLCSMLLMPCFPLAIICCIPISKSPLIWRSPPRIGEKRRKSDPECTTRSGAETGRHRSASRICLTRSEEHTSELQSR